MISTAMAERSRPMSRVTIFMPSFKHCANRYGQAKCNPHGQGRMHPGSFRREVPYVPRSAIGRQKLSPY